MKTGYTLSACVALVILSLAPLAGQQSPAGIRIGILHSQTGTMAVSERPLIDAALLAIEEVNRNGGLLGQPLKAVVVDGGSDPTIYKEQASRLIEVENVASVFGCWTSDCRKAVLPVLEQHRSLLWYPVQYEGQEASPFVIYTGAAPNQQIIPALRYGLERFGSKVFLIGSDYIFPRTANAIIKEYLRSNDLLPPVGEMYRSLSDWNFEDVVEAVSRARPDWIFNTVNGDSNVALFRALSTAPHKPPVMSVSIAEVEIPRIGIEQMLGHYAAWNYFQSVGTPENDSFVRGFKNYTALERVTDDPIEAAYLQIHLFAKAVKKARSREPARILEAARGLEMRAPGGWIRIDDKTQHTWKTARIGEVNQKGQFEERWSSIDPIRPDPYLRETSAPYLGESRQLSTGEVIAMLRQDPERRRYAARELGNPERQTGEVATALGQALRDDDWVVRRNAADSLVRRGAMGVGPLADALQESNERLRATAAFGLARLGKIAQPATPALIGSLETGDLETREESIAALAAIGPEAVAAVPALLAAMNDPEASIRLRSVDALGAVGAGAKEALPALTAALRSCR
jgi:urea transport system substrate-binding protein